MTKRIKRTPFERYRETFIRKIQTIEKRCTKEVVGLGNPKVYDIPSAKSLLGKAGSAKREAKARFSLKERHRKFLLRSNIIAKVAFRILADIQINSNEEFNFCARMIGNSIFDLPPKWTGYRTAAAIEGGENVDEHFYPRLWTGKQILSLVRDCPTITQQELIQVLDATRQIHRTTQQENLRLSHIKYTTWEEMYQQCCSELIQVEDRGPIISLPELLETIRKKHINTLDSNNTSVYIAKPGDGRRAVNKKHKCALRGECQTRTA